MACKDCEEREKLWLEYAQLLSEECNNLGTYKMIRGIETAYDNEKVLRGAELREKLGIFWDGEWIKYKD